MLNVYRFDLNKFTPTVEPGKLRLYHERVKKGTPKYLEFNVDDIFVCETLGKVYGPVNLLDITYKDLSDRVYAVEESKWQNRQETRKYT